MNAVTERQLGGDRAPAGATALPRICARPACSAPAAATLAFFYGAREVCLEKLGLDELPETYDLCATHADRTRPPYGWVLNDRRTVTKPAEATSPSSQPGDASPSVSDPSDPSTDSSRHLGWLGLAVEATVAFYAPNFDDFDAPSPSVEPASDDARAADHARREVRLVEPAPDDSRGVGDGGGEIPPVNHAPDETRPVDAATYEPLPQEEFVPVRAQNW